MNTRVIELINASNKELITLSKENVLSLSLAEMQAIRKYFKKAKRNPTDIELETLAQTWSEHCKHKTLTGIIEYKQRVSAQSGEAEFRVRSKDKKQKAKKAGKWQVRTYNNLLKETVFRATKELNKRWCISVFQDNAGIIEFDRNNGVAFKVETHNHPSALEPYGGAATGIGGVIRDILGVGLGAKPLANTDIFCFGPPDLAWSKLPKGVLHPKRIAKGVVSGVRDYGNRMGIPTVNGAVYFDEGYTCNPLVYCGTLGIIPKNKCFKKVRPGDLILVVGGRTGRDGIHGATFSSAQLDQETDVSAVQIGNPIVEKKALDTILQARDMDLYHAITDCGAGGLSSAVGELGKDCGVRVHLERVPLKYRGLKPWEIWLSEAQERMVLAVPKQNAGKIADVFRAEDVEATFIGEFTKDKFLTVLYEEDIVARLDMKFLHDGLPKQKLFAVWDQQALQQKRSGKKSKSKRGNLGQDLKNLLSSLNICSKEWIIRQYDHEVQGQTVIKPLHGSSIFMTGPGDASVIWPFTISKDKKLAYKGIVVSCGLNPEFGKIDPYWMAASSIDEALRNAVCVGADIERIALLDNFCWGNPNRPEQLGGIVRASQACYDTAKMYGTPFISGKDSLHNEYSIGRKLFSIPSALLISAVGVINDIRTAITMNLKSEGNLIYVLGITKDEMGGSHFNKVNGFSCGDVPKLDPEQSKSIMIALIRAIKQGLVCSCHDCSEGGIGVAIAEMAFASDKGVDLATSAVPSQGELDDAQILFSESNSRFIVEIKSDNRSAFENTIAGLPFGLVGRVVKGSRLLITGSKGKTIVREKLDDLRKAWRQTLDW